MKKVILLLFIIGCTFAVTSCETQDSLDEINVEEVSTDEDEDDGDAGTKTPTKN